MASSAGTGADEGREAARATTGLVLDRPRYVARVRSGPASVEHVRPEPWPGRNGTVAGVMTSVRRAREERIVVAADDVRHTRQTVERGVGLLGRAEAVRPQNYYLRLPGQSRWGSGPKVPRTSPPALCCGLPRG